jgi:hypothetical protein
MMHRTIVVRNPRAPTPSTSAESGIQCASRNPQRRGGIVVTDAFYLGLGVGFFALSLLFVAGLEALGRLS